MDDFFDNFKISMTAESKEMLSAGLKIALRGRTVTSFVITDNKRLHLHTVYVHGKHCIFPSKLHHKTVVEVVWEWLESLPGTAFGPKPDHDGDNRRAWSIEVPPNGCVGDVDIIPVWAMYGK